MVHRVRSIWNAPETIDIEIIKIQNDQVQNEYQEDFINRTIKKCSAKKELEWKNKYQQ